MDSLDAAILRELRREQVLLWGGMDHRLSNREIADRLDVDRTTVWARLKAWREEGFLVRQEIMPNPALFGAGVAGGDIQVRDPRRKPEVVDKLKLVDGVLAGFDLVGPYIVMEYAMESQSALDRCTDLVAKLDGVDEVSMCIPLGPPTSSLEPTPRDWRIIHALREDPDRPLADVAETLGLSRRTLSRRYNQLLEADAVWPFPVFDYSNYRDAVLARFVVVLSRQGETPAFVNACLRELDDMVWRVALEEIKPDAETDTPWVDIFCHLPSAAETEDVRAWLLDLPHVEDVEIFFPKSWFVASDWFDERIEARLHKAGEATG